MNKLYFTFGSTSSTQKKDENARNILLVHSCMELVCGLDTQVRHCNVVACRLFCASPNYLAANLALATILLALALFPQICAFMRTSLPLPLHRSKPWLIPSLWYFACLHSPTPNPSIRSLCAGHHHLQEHPHSHPSRVPPGPPAHGCVRRQAPAHRRDTAMPRPDPHHCGRTGERGLPACGIDCLSLLSLGGTWLSARAGSPRSACSFGVVLVCDTCLDAGLLACGSMVVFHKLCSRIHVRAMGASCDLALPNSPDVRFVQT